MTLRAPGRLTDRAAKPAEGGPGAAQCGARLRPAAPFFHPLPLPTPTARSILSLPSPRLHQSRPAEGLPPGRGTRHDTVLGTDDKLSNETKIILPIKGNYSPVRYYKLNLVFDDYDIEGQGTLSTYERDESAQQKRLTKVSY